MKKLISISLITLILLNAMGYYAVFLGIQASTDTKMVQLLDAENYDENKTVTLQIPLTVPYMSSSSDFVRVDGKFTHNGEFYRLVKQKYANDTLTVICVLDHETKRIQGAITDYVKTFTDNGHDQQPQSKITVSFIKDYIAQPFHVKNICPGWQLDVVQSTAYNNLISSYIASIVHPPERA